MKLTLGTGTAVVALVTAIASTPSHGLPANSAVASWNGEHTIFVDYKDMSESATTPASAATATS